MAYSPLNHGLSVDTVKNLTDIFQIFTHIQSVILYGSRANGNYTQNSDIDFAVFAPDMTDSEFSKLWNILDDLPLMYKIDCLHLDRLKNKALLDKIKKQGIVFFKRTDNNENE